MERGEPTWGGDEFDVPASGGALEDEIEKISGVLELSKIDRADRKTFGNWDSVRIGFCQALKDFISKCTYCGLIAVKSVKLCVAAAQRDVLSLDTGNGIWVNQIRGGANGIYDEIFVRVYQFDSVDKRIESFNNRCLLLG